MKITNVQFYSRGNSRRLSAMLELNNGKRHEVYFEAESLNKGLISNDASAFLPIALPIAMKSGEELFCDGTVSKKLFSHIPGVMKIMKSWNIGFKKISVVSSGATPDTTAMRNAASCFFSGGVDSFYTFLKNKKRIETLIFVHGFDISLKDVSLYNKVEKNIRKIAKKEKVNLLTVRTNLREVFEQYLDWEVSHEFALAAVTLFLRNGFNNIYMSCGQTKINADHHYMTPEIDVLWSTEKMKVNHYGCQADKISKLGFLSKSPIAMENLRVCWVNKNGEYNCGECEKCFRNMLALHAVASLDRCKTFKNQIDLSKLVYLKADKYIILYLIEVIKHLRLKKDNSAIKAALEKCVKNNLFPPFEQRIYRKARMYVRLIDKKYNQNRFYWYLARKGLA